MNRSFFSSIKFRIAAIVMVLGGILLAMVFYLAGKGKDLAEDIFERNSEFISSFLKESLNLGMQSYELLGDASAVEETLATVRALQNENDQEQDGTDLNSLLRNDQITLATINVFSKVDETNDTVQLVATLRESAKEQFDPATAKASIVDRLDNERQRLRENGEVVKESKLRVVDDDAHHRRIISSLFDAGTNTLYGYVEVEFSKAFLNNRSASNRNNSLLYGVLAFLGGMVFSMWVGLRITRRIANMNTVMRDVAEGEGDLTTRIDSSSKDELGELAGWFNQFLDKLQNTVREIIENSGILNNSSHDLSTVSTQMAGSSDDMSSKTDAVAQATHIMTEKINKVANSSDEATTNVNSVSSAVEEMSATLGQVSQTATQVSENTNTIAVALEEMSATVNEVTKNTEHAANVSKNAADKAKDTQGLMLKLGDSAESVGKVVQVIDEIAEKTNLLALNASIEAARAGEAGKGFNVVANEVKDLSNQTAEATQNIVLQIQEMQENTQTSIKAIEEITGIINELNSVNLTIAGAVEEQSVTTSEVSQTTAEAATSLEEVSKNVSDVSRAANDISTNASSMAELIEDISANINETARGAVEVSGSAGELNEAVGQVASGSQMVSGKSAELSNLANQLQTLTGQFKV